MHASKYQKKTQYTGSDLRYKCKQRLKSDSSECCLVRGLWQKWPHLAVVQLTLVMGKNHLQTSLSSQICALLVQQNIKLLTYLHINMYNKCFLLLRMVSDQFFLFQVVRPFHRSIEGAKSALQVRKLVAKGNLNTMMHTTQHSLRPCIFLCIRSVFIFN